jgi:ATP synthase protein I
MTDSKESRRELYKSIGFLSGVGISMVAATFIGFGMGYYLDQWFDTKPWLTMIFLVIGIVAGFRNIYILTARELRRQKREEQQLEKDRDADG